MLEAELQRLRDCNTGSALDQALARPYGGRSLFEDERVRSGGAPDHPVRSHINASTQEEAVRRPDFAPPTLEEAIFAAQGLTDDVEGQAEVAARLMGLPEAEVRAAILKAATARPGMSIRSPAQARFAAGRQPVVVERRAPRVRIR